MGLPFYGYAESTGELREIYDRMRERPMPPVYRPAHGGARDHPGAQPRSGADPEGVRHVDDPQRRRPLSWPERELINATTSRLNQCLY